MKLLLNAFKNLAIISFISMGLALTAAAKSTTADFFGFKTKTIDGKDYDFKDLKGKVTLIVNTASKCGFTPQLAQLEELHKKYGPQGLVILAVPSNDFKQELASGSEVKSFAEDKYKTTFTFLDKQTITGDQKSPLFQYLTEQKKNLVFKEVQWNFEKFLVDQNGQVINRWSSMTKPNSKDIVTAIETSLKK